MCSPAFSWNINKNGKIFHKDNLQSHSGLSDFYNLPDDYVVKAEYNWWENNPVSDFKVISKPFELSMAMIKNSEHLIQSLFNSRDTTFEWVKRNFDDTKIADKFVETYNPGEIKNFIDKFKNEINTGSLAHIIKFTLQNEIAATAFYSTINKFSSSELFHICLFTNNGKVRQSAYEAGIKGFTPSQLAKLALSSKDKEIAQKAFYSGLQNFSTAELVDLSINATYKDLDINAFLHGEKKFSVQELAKISMSAKSFPVRERAQKIYNFNNPKMNY